MSAEVSGLEAGIVTADAVALAGFYREGLGFEVVAEMTFPQGTVVRLRHGAAALKLYTPAGDTVPRADVPDWWGQRGFSYAALHVTDAEAVVEAAVVAGARVITPVTAHRPGARFALIADPEGNVWEVLEERPV